MLYWVLCEAGAVPLLSRFLTWKAQEQQNATEHARGYYDLAHGPALIHHIVATWEWYTARDADRSPYFAFLHCAMET